MANKGVGFGVELVGTHGFLPAHGLVPAAIIGLALVVEQCSWHAEHPLHWLTLHVHFEQNPAPDKSRVGGRRETRGRLRVTTRAGRMRLSTA